MQVKLKVMSGKNTGKEIPVTKKRFLIGRAEQCNLRPKSDAISRNHCAILVKEQGVLIRDLNSRNGTYINGEKISEDVELGTGDHLQLGKLEFEIVIKESKKKKKKKPAKAKTADAKPEKATDDSNSFDFDISEWLEDGDGGAKSKQADPETRQFKLDETDRIALEQAKVDAESGEEEEGRKRRFARPQKEPGKLPPREEDQASSSRDAAADMLKKFFNNR